MPKIKIPKFLKKKRNIWIIAILLMIIIIGAYFIFGRGKNTNSIQTGLATKQNLQETVLSTGQVVSSTNLNLSFQGSGIVRHINVKEGDKVKIGQTLATLDQLSALASLTSAQGTLAQAKANYEKLLAGATQQTVKTNQDSVNSAQQDLNNAYSSAINILNTGYTNVYNADALAKTIQDTYFTHSNTDGIPVRIAKADLDTGLVTIKINLDKAQASMSRADIDFALSQEIPILHNAYNDIAVIRTQSDSDMYYSLVTVADKATLDSQKTVLTTATTGVIALQQNIASLKLALQRAEDQLNVITAQPTQADIDLAKGQVLSAQGQVDSARAILNNSVIIAPVAGMITQVDIKVGEQAVVSQTVMVLQDVGDLHAEADVSEADVASLQVGQSIDYTFDALGPDQHFAGKILTINPASTVISGVVDYKVTGSLDNVPNIKPGMTANMTILVAKKDNVLAVPSTAIINNNSKQYVKVIDNAKNKTYHQVEVKTGLQADGGLVEITSGLNDGQQIVTYIKP